MNKKTRINIKVFILFMIIILCFAIYMKKTENTCNHCKINFSYKSLGEDKLKSIDLTISEIYNYFINDSCRIKRSNSEGFLINGN
jgi:hypothetical protein